MKIRLSPLAHVEEALIRKLNPFGTSQHEGIFVDADASLKEVALNSSVWRGIVGRWFNGRDSNLTQRQTDLGDPKDPAALIHACAQDMIQLWNDPAVKDSLVRKRLRVEEISGL